ncbi:uncharacterized protein LOC131150744 [Malania oleifera]|uniref:uncharacterized protein LOC131150744 n=1 Tax=Malania oleifera TaxID=397392 RepID=UPI0025AE0C5C|nr:uncharacterized protein LOC131150744 [Malania oleifera]
MEISVLANTLAVAATQGLGLSHLLRRNCFGSSTFLSLSDSYSDQPSSASVLQISAAIFPVDAVAPPPVRPNRYRVSRRTLIRKNRRTRRRSFYEGGGEEEGFYGDGCDGGDGPFGSGAGGGGGWNFGGFGGSNWDESSSSSSSDPAGPALDFLYEVISWIALSNCVHFAFKKVGRIVADGIGDDSREKLPMRLTAVC